MTVGHHRSRVPATPAVVVGTPHTLGAALAPETVCPETV